MNRNTQRDGVIEGAVLATSLALDVSAFSAIFTLYQATFSALCECDINAIEDLSAEYIKACRLGNDRNQAELDAIEEKLFQQLKTGFDYAQGVGG